MEKIEIELHPFNEIVIDNLITSIPHFIEGEIPTTKEEKKTNVYDKIKAFNSHKVNSVYNTHFELTVSTLN